MTPSTSTMSAFTVTEATSNYDIGQSVTPVGVSGSYTENVIELRGKGAIITGTRRFGAIIARRLAQEGVRIALVYRSSKDEAEALQQELSPQTQVVLIQADLSDEPQVERVVQTAKAELGDVSFLVNLAFDYPRNTLDELDAAAWDRGMAGAKANFLLALHSYRMMAQNDGPTRGHLIFFGDWAAAETPYSDFIPYLTGKAAVHFMTKAFGRDLAEFGILVNCIAPGPTALGVGMTDVAWTRAVGFTPLKRESSADDIAEMIVTLLRSETITGEIVRVDSGRHVVGSPLRDYDPQADPT
jgi:NAD(P)-dependent dehydrogenase (short-subunit alcohol dehydrogenase family)